MKITKKLAVTFIFFALNLNSFATDRSDTLLNKIEINKSDIASVLIKNGRNQNLKTNQDDTAPRFAATESNEENSPAYANNGRNNKMVNEMISMN